MTARLSVSRPSAALAAALGLVLLLPGCLSFRPETSREKLPTVAEAPWPELAPLGPILRDTETLKAAENPTPDELARAEALRRRADEVRAIDPSEGL
ncbi:hypothetical protein [Frigidibacter sp. MR17.24]|uniref:hypothetical protein n=1 Tax=Frigidibacter sp. MR17.24 TaxID=3127345 RepID=UPI003013139A